MKVYQVADGVWHVEFPFDVPQDVRITWSPQCKIVEVDEDAYITTYTTTRIPGSVMRLVVKGA